jgi:hypothetical protein
MYEALFAAQEPVSEHKMVIERINGALEMYGGITANEIDSLVNPRPY